MNDTDDGLDGKVRGALAARIVESCLTCRPGISVKVKRVECGERESRLGIPKANELCQLAQLAHDTSYCVSLCRWGRCGGDDEMLT